MSRVTATETAPEEVVIAGHRFLVRVRIFHPVAEHEVGYAVRYQDGLKAEATEWSPYDKPRGDDHVASSVLNGTVVVVDYLGPVAEIVTPVGPENGVHPAPDAI